VGEQVHEGAVPDETPEAEGEKKGDPQLPASPRTDRQESGALAPRGGDGRRPVTLGITHAGNNRRLIGPIQTK